MPAAWQSSEAARTLGNQILELAACWHRYIWTTANLLVLWSWNSIHTLAHRVEFLQDKMGHNPQWILVEVQTEYKCKEE